MSEQRGLPVEVVADSQANSTISSETVQLKYYSTGTLTNDAGEAAGTVVVGKLAKGGILNALGDVIGTYLDTSLTFTSTALTTEVIFPYIAAERFDRNTGTLKADAVTEGFSNGDYCVDYRTGTVYGVKASTQSSLTATSYIITAQQIANVTAAAGSSTHDSAAASDGTHPMLEAADFDGSALPNAVAEGDAARAKGSLSGVQYVMVVSEDGSTRPAYDSGTDSFKQFEVNPLSDHYQNTSLADTTNISSGGVYYPSSTGATMDGYSDLSFTGKLIEAASDSITLTVEMSNDEDTSGDWIQVYFYDDQNDQTVNQISVTGDTVAYAISLNKANFRRYRVLVDADSATNTVIVKERKKAL